MMPLRGLTLLALVVCAPTYGQWLKYPTPWIPRTANGSPDLKATTPVAIDGKPDLSGIWSKGPFPDTTDLPLTAAARASMEERLARDPQRIHGTLTQCLPHFFVHIVPLSLYKIVQTPGLIVILYEAQGQPVPRQIFLDGRPLPKNPVPSWMGYSVGHWEDNALVVETIGLNDRGEIPATDIRITETMHVVERYERPDFGHLKIQVTIEDPQTFTKPWTFTLSPQLQADTELLEYVCERNDETIRHMVGDGTK